MKEDRVNGGRSSCLAFVGTVTLLQAIFQAVLSGLGIAQYFCLIDLLREFPTLLFIKIMYFHNPDVCGSRINIGQSIPSIPDQAFVMVITEPLTVTRTFIINCCCLGLSVTWFICSSVLMRSASVMTIPFRWPWVLVTVLVSSVDIIAAIIYLNDIFYTKTLSETMKYIGATASGIGYAEIDTSSAAWWMSIVYSRFIVFIILNVALIIIVLVERNRERNMAQRFSIENPIYMTDLAGLPIYKEESETSSAPAKSISSQTRVTQTQQSQPQPTQPQPSQSQPSQLQPSQSQRSLSDSQQSPVNVVKLPRVNMSNSFRRMKRYLFPKRNSHLIPVTHPLSTPSIPAVVRSPPSPTRTDFDKKRSVTFPVNLLSLPQRLENMIAEQQRQLDQSVIDAAGSSSPTRVSQSLPQLSQDTQSSDELLESIATKGRRRRSTVAELQRELPWTYLEASPIMRDNLSSDEELPPVPLPDYTVMHYRRASVHRAPSTLDQRREELAKQNLRRRSPLTVTDVLY